MAGDTGEGWADAPIVVVTRPACWHCGDLRPPVIIRSEANGDGSVTRKVVCRRCSLRYKIVVEPPAVPTVGNPAEPWGYD